MEELGRRWYAVHTYSGYENKVKINLEKRVTSMAMEDKIFRVLVPTEDQVVLRNGKRKVVSRKLYPGYVLVDMIETSDSWYVVRNTPGVTGFVGSDGKPVPLEEEEAKKILRFMGIKEARPRVQMDLNVGDDVRIVNGPFTNFTGKVESVNTEKEKVKLLVDMFGRQTPMELDFIQIEKNN